MASVATIRAKARISFSFNDAPASPLRSAHPDGTREPEEGCVARERDRNGATVRKALRTPARHESVFAASPKRRSSPLADGDQPGGSLPSGELGIDIMATFKRGALRVALLATSTLGAVSLARPVLAEDAPAAPAPVAAETASVSEVVVTVNKTPRSSVTLGGDEMQKILPGINPLKAIQTLPGVLFETADPWGNNEQNEVLYVHGFSTQQLGYTMDGVPLGDQQYGNYNGLSVSRAVTSENVSKVLLSSGAGNLGVASTSNLGGTIETFSVDPGSEMGGRLDQTVGSYMTTRTFLRLETGAFGAGGENSGYVSYVHQDQRAWDFNGHQRDDQVNAKFVHKDAVGKLTLYFDWSDKVEPNEDATFFKPGYAFEPYTRPFLYPNLGACVSSLSSLGAPLLDPNNFSNCYSAAQRTDYLGYGRYDWTISSNLTWSNTAYYHHDEGRGLVGGPVNQAGLPTLFATYYPNLVVGGSPTSAGTLTNLINVFGGTGLEVRETEYLINRGGLISTLEWKAPGGHDIEAGVWWEHVNSQTDRNWFPFAAANEDLSPYDVPINPAFTQYESRIGNNVVVFHVQDQWRLRPDLMLVAGFKSSFQFAYGRPGVQQVNTNLPKGAVPNNLPTGQINTAVPFLPELGATWDFNANGQLFVNVQKNVRQFITYGAAGLSPWSLGSQDAFNLFKQTAKPETSWTYEAGLRGHSALGWGFLSAIEGQASVYHVDFSNRLLQVSQFNFINPNPSVLANVGSVSTSGVDIAGTLHFGPHVSLYNALSYNRSVYGSDYLNNGVPVHTKGKWVLDSPDWLNKTVASFNYGPFEGQLIGDYVGRRYATYLNDLRANPYFTLELETSWRFPAVAFLKAPKVSLNVTNLTSVKGVSSFGNTNVSGSYTAFPIAPVQGFLTLSSTF
jgi:hypothetical protein